MSKKFKSDKHRWTYVELCEAFKREHGREPNDLDKATIRDQIKDRQLSGMQAQLDRIESMVKVMFDAKENTRD